MQGVNNVNAMDTDQRVININDFTDSLDVVSNQNNQPYATSLTIVLPNGSEITPIQLSGVVHENRDNIDTNVDDVSAGKIIPFNNFSEAPVNARVALEPDEAVVVVSSEDNSKYPGHIVGCYQNDFGVKKYLRFLDNCKAVVIKTTEMAGYVSKLAIGLFDVYKKIKMFVPITTLGALAAAADDSNVYDIQPEGKDAMTTSNQVLLLHSTFDLVDIEW